MAGQTRCPLVTTHTRGQRRFISLCYRAAMAKVSAGSDDVPLYVRIDPDVSRALRSAANHLGVSLSTIVECILANTLGVSPVQKQVYVAGGVREWRNIQ